MAAVRGPPPIRKSIVSPYEEKSSVPRNAPKARVFHYNYDYTNKIWRAQACDENGKVMAVES